MDKVGVKMKSIRQKVFETNSSSTHSISLSYIDNSVGSLPYNLPRYDKDRTTEIIDIQSVYLKQDGLAYGEVEKLRIIIALVSEMIYDEYFEPLKKDWILKHPNLKYDWKAWSEYYYKKCQLKGTKKYFLENRYWGYINNVLKKHCNISLKLYALDKYPPYVSSYVDEGLSCESSKNYLSLGFKENMERLDFQKLVEKIIFTDTIGIEQETYRDGD